jgi:CPA1 family monovalent cation:H+ antiporter
VANVVVIGATVACLRIIWVFPSAYLPRLIPAVRRRDPKPPNPKQVFLVSWTGLRGIVSLAAALALPGTFPYRDLIVLTAELGVFLK